MILVTGASGFLGGELVKQLLANNHPVRIIVRPGSNLNHLKKEIDILQVVEADILDVMALNDAMLGVTEVYHSAAVIAYHRKYYDVMYKTNIEGTANVVNSALQNGVKKIVQISSIAAIGGKPNELISETTKWEQNEWSTQYGLTKQLAEREIYRGIEEGLLATIINPGIIVGVGNDEQKATLRLFKQIAMGKLPFYTPGTNGFVDVRDVVSLAIKLMKADNNGERYIAVSGNYSFKEYFNQVATILNVPPPKYQLSTVTVKLLYTLDALLSIIQSKRKRGFTKENAKIAMQSFYYSNYKIKRAFNFEFIPMEQTIQDIVKYIKDGI